MVKPEPDFDMNMLSSGEVGNKFIAELRDSGEAVTTRSTGARGSGKSGSKIKTLGEATWIDL